jgi:hypothetical protein
MLYASTTDGALLIGLSAKNLEKLRAGQPILRHGVGRMPTLRIVFGETEQAIIDMLVKEGVLDPALAARAWRDPDG